MLEAIALILILASFIPLVFCLIQIYEAMHKVQSLIDSLSNGRTTTSHAYKDSARS